MDQQKFFARWINENILCQVLGPDFWRLKKNVAHIDRQGVGDPQTIMAYLVLWRFGNQAEFRRGGEGNEWLLFAV